MTVSNTKLVNSLNSHKSFYGLCKMALKCLEISPSILISRYNVETCESFSEKHMN